MVIAHRGDSSRAIENSLEAIRRALEVPADMIEVDIRKSRDGMLFALHDRETGRTADSSIDIEQSIAGEIARLRLKNGEPIPTLQAVLELISGRAGLNVELKSDGSGAVLAQHLVASPYAGPMFISSFKEPEVNTVREAFPEIPVACIVKAITPEEIPAYKARGYSLISLKRAIASEELIAVCHEQGIGVYVWTVDDEREMETFIAWGADGIYTNRPMVLKRVRDRA